MNNNSQHQNNNHQFQPNHTSNGSQAVDQIELQEISTQQLKYQQYAIKELVEQARKEIEHRRKLIREVYRMREAEKKFNEEGFYNGKFVYLVSKKWIQLWKKYTQYEQIVNHKKINLIQSTLEADLGTMNKDLFDSIFYPTLRFRPGSEMEHYNIALNPTIKENENFQYYSADMWEIVKHYKHDEIKRNIVQIPGKKEKIVEIFLQKITLVLLTNKIIASIGTKKKQALQVQFVQFSKFSAFGTFKFNSSQLILDNLSKQTLLDINYQSFTMHFWFLDPAWDLNKLFSRVKKSAEFQEGMKQFTICLCATQMQENKTLEEQLGNEQAVIVCQILNNKQDRIIYHLKSNVTSKCPKCGTATELSTQCKCRYIAYCSQQCLKTDINHLKKCPQISKQDVKQQEIKKQRNGLVGLTNLGNTCFMNSGIQCLSNLKQLTEYFISGKYAQDINKDNPLGTKGNLSHSYYQMMCNMWCESNRVFTPYIFKKSVSAFQNMFSGCEQHDSGEFLTYFLDGLHEDLNKVKNKSYIQNKDEDNRSEKIIAAQQWSNFLRRNDSKIVQLMYGQFRSQVDCPKCKYQSIQFDPFLICSLPIPSLNNLINGSHSGTNEQRKIVMYLQKEGNTQQQIIYYYTFRDTMLKVAEYIEQKFNSENKPRIIFFTSKILLDMKQQICQIKARYKQKIYARFLSDLQSYNGCKVWVYFHEEKINKFNEKIPTIFSEKLFLFKSHLTFEEIHLFLYKTHKKLYEVQNYERMMKNQLLKEKPIQIMVKEDMMSSTCWNCKCRCKGCQIPMSSTKIGQAMGSKNSISLNYLIKKSITGSPKPQTNGLHSVNLLDCFKAFEEPEILVKDNAWYCSKCKELVNAKKQMMIYKSPKILILCLKRFKKKLYSSEKNSTFIDFPVKNLDLTKVVVSSKLPQISKSNGSQQQEKTPENSDGKQQQKQKILYDLFAVSYHEGDVNSGHYTAACLNSYTKKWYHFNDDKVFEMEQQKVVSKNAYILFYRRK